MPAPYRALALSAALTLGACTDGEPGPATPPARITHFEGEYSLVDDGAMVPGWEAFRDSLRACIAKRDTSFLLSVVAEDARLGYDTDLSGPEGFAELWLGGAPPEDRDPFETLGAALDGGSLDEDGAVIAPFVYALWPDEHDPLSSVAIVGEGIAARSGPNEEADTTAVLANLIVPALAPPDRSWRMIQLPDGEVAYVEARHALSPVGYRATFWPEPDGTWKLRSFLAGD